MFGSPRVAVGVHVHAEPERLLATLSALRAANPDGEIVLLPDGPDEPTRRVLATLSGLPVLGTPAPAGGAACFNRLVAASDADVFVLLESGAVVGPGWREMLLAALAADSRNGLAGPSTNLSWNDQAIYASRTGTQDDVARTANDARLRFGNETRSLEPLYSLADFCYAVKREVVVRIGAADERYGLGPCWEMDYNIRAARGGFRGVWALGAYVYRAPFTTRRRIREAQLFENSRRLYQDRFCALRLRGERMDYEPHCRGDACELFAPSDLIEVSLKLPPAPAHITVTAPPPLVSCIMPTRDRREFVLQSVGYFQRQQYPSLELIVVDDGTTDLTPHLPPDPRIRYTRMPPGQSIGAKRNHACALARGSFIAQWDDDDWYGPHRIEAQMGPLLAGKADITGFKAGVFFDLPRWEFWGCSPDLHRRLFVGDVHGGTLVYRRSVWRGMAHYPDTSLAEDAVFLTEAMRRGASLHRLSSEGLFMYVRHARNAWDFVCGQYLDPHGWRRLVEPAELAEDRDFYARARSHAETEQGAGGPLVTCMMPTSDRRAFVPQAIGYFQRQDYPYRELLVLDDGEADVADLIRADPRIRYVRLDRRMPLGAKRNAACDLARGTIVAHWDDDDWYAPTRLREQVGVLERGADVCGARRQLYYEPAAERAWLYEYPAAAPRWVAGNTLCYRKSAWASHPFPDVTVGEDALFVAAADAARVAEVPGLELQVGIVHPANTSPKETRSAWWHPQPADRVRRVLGSDLAFYQALV